MASSDVVLSAALRNNLLSLQGTQRLIDTVQLRLATGLKVNSALDGPQQFFTSQSLTNRAGDLARLLDGINLSIRTIEEADKGVTALTSLLEQASALADEAKGVALSASGFAQIKSTVDLSNVDSITADSGGTIAAGDDIVVRVVRANGAIVTMGGGATEISLVATDTVYSIASQINSNTSINPYVRATVDNNGRLTITSLEEGASIRISDGTTSLGADGYAFLGLDHFIGTEENVAAQRQGGTAIAGRTIYSVASAAATVNGLYEASATASGAGFLDGAGTDSANLILTIDGITYDTGAIVDGTTIQEIVDNINNTVTGGEVVARFNTTTGRIEMEYADSVGYVMLEMDSNAVNTKADFGWSGSSQSVAATEYPTDTNMPLATDDMSERFNFSGSAADLARYQDDFNTIRDQIDALVEDANFRGVNLLGGDTLTTFFNEDRSNSLETVGQDLTAAGLGITAATFTNAGSVQTSIDQLLTATDMVRNFGSTIANSLSIIQTRRDFTESTIATLKAGAGDLVNADQNEEGANLLALQTRQQLGVTALSLAAQSQQSVLRLF